MKKLRANNKKASALLIAIMITSVFAAAIVGVTALAIRQIAISRAYNSGLVALYSAESGVEEGLLRFRFDKNTEVPKNMQTFGNDPLGRVAKNGYLNYLDWQKRGFSSSRGPRATATDKNNGESLEYPLTDFSQVYAYSVYFGENYFGQDVNGDGKLDQLDLQSADYGKYSDFTIKKDENKSYSVISNDGNITLYWRWLSPCSSSNKHALQVKLKVADTDSLTGNDSYSILFEDPNCPVTNGSSPEIAPGSPVTFTIADLKARLNISSKQVVEMTVHPVGQNSNGDIYFGFKQKDSLTKVAGAKTTVRSIGYFRGVTREMIAEVDRQTGTILDLFNYVLYKGE